MNKIWSISPIQKTCKERVFLVGGWEDGVSGILFCYRLTYLQVPKDTVGKPAFYEANFKLQVLSVPHPKYNLKASFFPYLWILSYINLIFFFLARLAYLLFQDALWYVPASPFILECSDASTLLYYRSLLKAQLNFHIPWNIFPSNTKLVKTFSPRNTSTLHYLLG